MHPILLGRTPLAVVPAVLLGFVESLLWMMLTPMLGEAWRSVPTVEEPSSQVPFTPAGGAHRPAEDAAGRHRTGSAPDQR
ncbi:MAG: hypothetical protein ACOC84_01080 [Actinomycetota bacterium]